MNEDVWSGDEHFINNINSCIQFYGQAVMEGDLKKMFEIVEFFETITSPAIDCDIVEKNLDEIDNLLPQCYILNERGVAVGENVANVKYVRSKIKETFRLILIKLEEQGIYRHKGKDPKHAMANFGSS